MTVPKIKRVKVINAGKRFAPNVPEGTLTTKVLSKASRRLCRQVAMRITNAY